MTHNDHSSVAGMNGAPGFTIHLHKAKQISHIETSRGNKSPSIIRPKNDSVDDHEVSKMMANVDLLNSKLLINGQADDTEGNYISVNI